MKQQLQKVQLKDFTIAALKQLAREGRLYYAVEKAEPTRQQIAEYVKRISHLAAPEFEESINAMWDDIINNDVIAPKFVMKRKKEINKYYILSIVCVMSGYGVYRSDLTPLDLHLILEDIKKRNSIYTGMTKYPIERKELSVLWRIIDAHRGKLHEMQK